MIDPPGFKLSQDERLGYQELEKRIFKTDLTLYVILSVILSALIYLAKRLF